MFGRFLLADKEDLEPDFPASVYRNMRHENNPPPIIYIAEPQWLENLWDR